MCAFQDFYYNMRRRILSRIVKKRIDLSDVTLLSSNCVGGVLYHDCGCKFLSPTIDLFFAPPDFIKFINNLDMYLSETLRVVMGSKFPIGVLGDIKIYFMHYKTTDEAMEKWETRKKRINKDKIFVTMVERNGFSQNDYEEFLKIGYPKFLFAKSESYKCKDSLCMPMYKNLKEIPDIIPGRYMYYKMALPKAINRAFKNDKLHGK